MLKVIELIIANFVKKINENMNKHRLKLEAKKVVKLRHKKRAKKANINEEFD